jgi:predicted ferric reductase
MLIWYLARGAGISAFGALSVATAAGALASRRTPALQRRLVLQYVHRSAAMAGLGLLALHIPLIVADSYANVGLLGAFVPFTSGYRPVGVALGLLGMYLLVAVAVTGALRSRFAHSARATRTWRAVHLLSYVAWASAAIHFWLVGTDTKQWWALAVLFGGVALVALAAITRLAGRPAHRRTAPLGVAAQPLVQQRQLVGTIPPGRGV